MKQPIDIVVFARSPKLGCVKKRLASKLSEEETLVVYRKLFKHALTTVARAAVDYPSLNPVLNYLGEMPTQDIPASWIGTAMPQVLPTMTQNFSATVEQPVTSDRCGVIVIGVDHPLLEVEHIISMARLLDEHQVGIGPTEDGGFWALATSVPLGTQVASLPMGTSGVFEALQSALHDCDIDFGLGPLLWDVDRIEDLDRWKKTIKRRNR
jgi:uncharacterized protein